MSQTVFATHCLPGRRYDGYRLTYLGYDYLAIKTLVNRGSIAGVGRQVCREQPVLRGAGHGDA